jgi:hypothetical protein
MTGTYVIRYNGRTNHLQGLPEKTLGGEFDYPVSACAALSRSGWRMAMGKRYEDLAEAVKALKVTGQRHACANCLKRAEQLLAA